MPKKSSASAKKVQPDPYRDDDYRLMLFVTGATPNSVRAVANVKRICEENLSGRYSLEIVDVYIHRQVAAEYQLVALPMLLKKKPDPQRKVIGDFSDIERVLSILDINTGL